MAHKKEYDSQYFEFTTGNQYIKGRVYLYNITRTRSREDDEVDSDGLALYDSTDTLTMSGHILYKRTNDYTGPRTQSAKNAINYTIYLNGNVETTGTDKGIGWTVPNKGETESGVDENGWTWVNNGGFAIKVTDIEPMKDYNFTIGVSITGDKTAFNVSHQTSSTITLAATATQIGKSSTVGDFILSGKNNNTVSIEAKIGTDGTGGNKAHRCHMYYSTNGQTPYPAEGWPYKSLNIWKDGNIVTGAGNTGTCSYTITESCTFTVKPYTTSVKQKWWAGVDHPGNAESVKSILLTFNNAPSWGEDNIATLQCMEKRSTPNAIYRMIWPKAVAYDDSNPIQGYRLCLYRIRDGVETPIHSSNRTIEELNGRVNPDNEGQYFLDFSNVTVTSEFIAGDNLYFTIEPYAKVTKENRTCYGDKIESEKVTIGSGGYVQIVTQDTPIRYDEGKVYVKSLVGEILFPDITNPPFWANHRFKILVEEALDNPEDIIFTLLSKSLSGTRQTDIYGLWSLDVLGEGTIDIDIGKTLPIYEDRWTTIGAVRAEKLGLNPTTQQISSHISFSGKQSSDSTRKLNIETLNNDLYRWAPATDIYVKNWVEEIPFNKITQPSNWTNHTFKVTVDRASNGSGDITFKLMGKSISGKIYETLIATWTIALTGGGKVSSSIDNYIILDTDHWETLASITIDGLGLSHPIPGVSFKLSAQTTAYDKPLNITLPTKWVSEWVRAE